MPDGRVLFRLMDSRLCLKLRLSFRPLDERKWFDALERRWPVERIHQGFLSGYVLLERSGNGELATLMEWLLDSVELLSESVKKNNAPT